MINKREKLQYAYVFALDLLMLFVSVLLAWLITDGLMGLIVPYSTGDWVQTICLVVLAFNLVGDGLRDAFDPKLKR